MDQVPVNAMEKHQGNFLLLFPSARAPCHPTGQVFLFGGAVGRWLGALGTVGILLQQPARLQGASTTAAQRPALWGYHSLQNWAFILS